MVHIPLVDTVAMQYYIGRSGMSLLWGLVGEASGWGTHVNPWLIHVNVWQKPLQYCKIISLQLIKINEKINWGSNLSQFFLKKIHFKGVVLELLAPIYKRESSCIHSCGFFPLGASLSTPDRG